MSQRARPPRPGHVPDCEPGRGAEPQLPTTGTPRALMLRCAPRFGRSQHHPGAGGSASSASSSSPAKGGEETPELNPHAQSPGAHEQHPRAAHEQAAEEKAATSAVFIMFFWGDPPQPALGERGSWHVLGQGRNSFIKSNTAKGLSLRCPHPISALGEVLRGQPRHSRKQRVPHRTALKTNANLFLWM